MNADEFRAALARLGLTQVGFARFLRDQGDPGQFPSIIRRVQRWASGDYRIPGEVIALLSLLRASRQK